jgi:FKBP-type peptidyl-prolyl cis-trans isomerase FkpA
MTKKLILLAAVTITVSSCNDSDFSGYTKAESGLHYKFFNHDESGTKVQEGDNIYVRYRILRHDNDSLIVDSKDVSRDGTGYVNFNFKKSSFSGSFEDGLKMMAKGDSAEFIIPADSFFLKSYGMNELPKGIKSGSHLRGLFKVKDLTPAKEVEVQQKKQMAEREAEAAKLKETERPAIDKFLADNKINVKPTATGLYYVETVKGSGPSPKADEVVKVHYTGKFLDGRVFDSSVERNEPVEFGLNQVIAGWTEGLQLMKKGGKANMVIPSELAYGPQGRQGIPPYTPLYFEVELIDIKPAPAPSSQMPPQGGH